MTTYSKPKLDELVQNLEESSDRLIELVGVAETIRDLKTKQDELHTEFDEAIEAVTEAAEELARSAKQAEVAAGNLTQRISDELGKIQSKVDARLKTVDDTLTTGLDGIKRENRQHYTDLETLVRLKLDENKAEIKQLIEHERGQIATFIDTRSQAVEDFIVAKIDDKMSQLLKNQQTTQTSLWLLGGLLVVVLAKLFWPV